MCKQMVMYTSIDFPNEATASMQLELFDHEMLQSPFEPLKNLNLWQRFFHDTSILLSLLYEN